jgi:DNA-binding response OmpR family regulator
VTRVLVVDDDGQILRALRSNLTARGYEVLTATDGAGALRAAADGRPDVVVLALGLPDLDGSEVIAGLRGWTQVPIIVLSGRTDAGDEVDALDAGADDYVTKPFRLAELLARVRALLRRGSAEVPGTVRGVRVDPEARRAWHGDTELDLTTKEFDLLWILLRDAGKVVTREQIMHEVWDAKWWSSTKTLDMHISWLRRKLGDDAHHPRHITTVRGVGFRFERGD